MSKLVTITSKFYDKSGRYVRNLKVKSRYQNSSRENLKKTDTDGLFVFQASPNRMVEILAKPPKASDYTVVKVINSSTLSSSEHPIKIQLPNTIEEYRQMNSTISQNGLVVTPFQVVDVHGKIMAHFPIQTRPKGKKSFERITDDQGRVEVLSSANRDIEFLALTSNDEFVLKRSLNSGNGTEKPILIQLDEPYEKFKSTSTLTLVDREGSNYVIEKTNIEMLIVATGKKKVYSISNGKLPLISMVGQRLQFTVLKPDGKPLDPVSYVAKRVKEEAVKLHLDVDIIEGTTEENKPNLDNRIDNDSEDIISLSFFKAVYGSRKLFSHRVMNGRSTQNTTPEEFVPELNKSLRKHNLKDKLMLCHFLAQIYHECDHFNTLIEYASGKDYDISNFPPSVCDVKNSRACRRRNQILAEGNTSFGDGPKYKGRGLIQLTWKSAYKKYKNYSGIDVVSNPELICDDLFHAVESSVWAFNIFKNADNLIYKGYPDLNSNYSDSHHLKVVESVSKRINGGNNGMLERKKLFIKILREVEKRNGFK
ncbi:glycoside hydrolase family 19 protein [Acinetobacter indicus]|uniref:glycoside hydrolase family 19 protein n=1 Tax=Acinetobacter indicus TaxID=756892 RepID=UPI00136365F2|nr:glycoside hydrolase family 19 protein [Acinetobacter indicus]